MCVCVRVCIQLTQKCAITFTLNERSIRWSGVSNRCSPETTPALLISKVTCERHKNTSFFMSCCKHFLDFCLSIYYFLPHQILNIRIFFFNNLHVAELAQFAFYQHQQKFSTCFGFSIDTAETGLKSTFSSINYVFYDFMS